MICRVCSTLKKIMKTQQKINKKTDLSNFEWPLGHSTKYEKGALL
jgi:hypothetical protein